MEYNVEDLFVGKVQFASFVSGKDCFTNNRYIFRNIKSENGQIHWCELISMKSFYPLTDGECVFVRAVKTEDFRDVFPNIDKVSYEDIVFLETSMYGKDSDCVYSKKLVVNK